MTYDGVHHAMLGIARLHNLTLAGSTSATARGQARPELPGEHLRDNPWLGHLFLSQAAFPTAFSQSSPELLKKVTTTLTSAFT